MDILTPTLGLWLPLPLKVEADLYYRRSRTQVEAPEQLQTLESQATLGPLSGVCAVECRYFILDSQARVTPQDYHTARWLRAHVSATSLVSAYRPQLTGPGAEDPGLQESRVRSLWKLSP